MMKIVEFFVLRRVSLVLLLSLCCTCHSCAQLSLKGESKDVRKDFGSGFEKYPTLDLLNEDGKREFQIFFFREGSGIQSSTIFIAKTRTDKDGGAKWKLFGYRKFSGWITEIVPVNEKNGVRLKLIMSNMSNKKEIFIDLDYSGNLFGKGEG